MAQNNFSPGVVDYSDDPILPPWYVPGWTAQNAEQAKYAIPAPKNNIASFTNLPQSMVYINVNGNYTDGNGANLGGYLTFEQSADLLIEDATSTFYRVPKRLTGQIATLNTLAYNAEGSGKVYLQFGTLNVMLLATDQPSATVTIQEPYKETQEAGFVQPTTWVYHVREYFMDGFKYDIGVPSSLASSGTPVDINSLIIANTLERNHDWNRGY